MLGERYNIAYLKELPHYNILFDANILICEYISTTIIAARRAYAKNYRRAIAYLRKQKHFQGYVTREILSEVFNAPMRTEYNHYQKQNAIYQEKFTNILQSIKKKNTRRSKIFY